MTDYLTRLGVEVWGAVPPNHRLTRLGIEVFGFAHSPDVNPSLISPEQPQLFSHSLQIDIAVTPQLQQLELAFFPLKISQPYTLESSLIELGELIGCGYYGIDVDVDPSLIELDVLTCTGNTFAEDTAISPRLFAIEDILPLGAELVFSIDFNPFGIDEPELFSPELEYDIFITPGLVDAGLLTGFSSDPEYGTEWEATLQVLGEPELILVSELYEATAGMAPYVEGQFSQTLYGSAAGVFKLNVGSTTHRHRRRVGTLHTTGVKPSIVTETHDFTLLTSTPFLAAGDFLYEAPGQYLRLRNLADIELSLIADDSGNDYVSTAQVQNDTDTFVFSTFYP